MIMVLNIMTIPLPTPVCKPQAQHLHDRTLKSLSSLTMYTCFGIHDTVETFQPGLLTSSQGYAYSGISVPRAEDRLR